jgi:hypothetical protein
MFFYDGVSDREFDANIRNYVFVSSSLQLATNCNTLRTLLQMFGKEYHLDSWTKEDYYDAVQIPMIFESVLPYLVEKSSSKDPNSYSFQEKKDLIDNKFPVAGTCCRFMFDLPKQLVRDDIHKALTKVIRHCLLVMQMIVALKL